MRIRVPSPKLACALLLVLVAFLPATAYSAVQKGIVEVDGYAWGGDVAQVDLNTLSGGTDVTVEGETVKAFSLLEILSDVDSADFDLATLPKVEIAYPKKQLVTYTGNQIRNSANETRLARFFVGADGLTNILLPGQDPVAFEDINPKIYDPTQLKTLEVSLSPPSKEITSGDSVRFKATVANSGGNPVEYQWSFGDGDTKKTSTGSIAHTFRGKDRQFVVTVNVVGDGFRPGQDTSAITIGKVEPKKKEKKDDEETTPPADGGYTDPGYGGYTYPGSGGYPGGSGGYPGGAGTSPGAGSSTPADPQPKDRTEPPVDDGLTMVTGELVSGSAPAQTTTPGESGAEPPVAVTPTADGFAISSGAWTAIGLLALLGIGLLAEARGSRLR